MMDEVAETDSVGVRGLSARPRPRARRVGPKRWGRAELTGVVLVAPAATLIVCLFLLPLGLGAWMSLNNWPLLGSHVFIGLGNYRQLVDDSGARHALLFTLGFTAVVVPVVFVGGLGLALLLKQKRRGVSVFRSGVVAPVAIGFATASYLWLSLLDPSTGVFNELLVDLHVAGKMVNWLAAPSLALLMVVIVTVWKLAGFAMIILLNGLQSVPGDVEEAAKVDGAGPLRSLLSVQLPLMRRSIVLSLVFVALACMLAFDQFYIMTGGAPNDSTVTAVFKIYDTAFIDGNLGYSAAMSIVLLAVVLIITGAQLAFLPRRKDG
jgi:multiple sugar transport system permease protein